MRSAPECLVKALEMDAMALNCRAVAATHYQAMALSWRKLARLAAWQDAQPR